MVNYGMKFLLRLACFVLDETTLLKVTVSVTFDLDGYMEMQMQNILNVEINIKFLIFT